MLENLSFSPIDFFPKVTHYYCDSLNSKVTHMKTRFRFCASPKNCFIGTTENCAKVKVVPEMKLE